MKTIKITEEQLYMIIESIISQIKNNNKAIELVSSKDIAESIKTENKNLSELIDLLTLND